MMAWLLEMVAITSCAMTARLFMAWPSKLRKLPAELR